LSLNLQASAEHMRGASSADGRRPFSASGSLGSLSGGPGSHSNPRPWATPSPGLFASASGGSSSASHSSQSISAQLRAQRRVSETIAAAMEAENGRPGAGSSSGASSILQQARLAALGPSSSGSQGRKSSARSNCSSSSANSGCSSSSQVDGHSSGSCSDSSGLQGEVVAGDSSASYMDSITPRTSQLLRTSSAGAARAGTREDCLQGHGSARGGWASQGTNGNRSSSAGRQSSTSSDARRAKHQQHHHRHRLEKQMARYYATLRSCGLISGDPHAAASQPGGEPGAPPLPPPGASLPPAYPIFNTHHNFHSHPPSSSGKAPRGPKVQKASADAITRQDRECAAQGQGQSHDNQSATSSPMPAGLPPTPTSCTQQQSPKEGTRSYKPSSAKGSSNGQDSRSEVSKPCPTSPAALSPAVSAAAAASRAALHSLRRSTSWAAGCPESPRNRHSLTGGPPDAAAQPQSSILTAADALGRGSGGWGVPASATTVGAGAKRPGSSTGATGAAPSTGVVQAQGGVPRVAGVMQQRMAAAAAAMPSPLERELLGMRMQTAISMSNRFVPGLSVQASRPLR
jgi:hypothetical protein